MSTEGQNLFVLADEKELLFAKERVPTIIFGGTPGRAGNEPQLFVLSDEKELLIAKEQVHTIIFGGTQGPPGRPGKDTLPKSNTYEVSDSDWVLLDSATILEVDSQTWRIQSDSLNTGERLSMFVAASHNGIAGSSPSDIKWTVFGCLRFGALQCQIDLRLFDDLGIQKMGLFVKTVPSSEVKVWRLQSL